MKKILFPFSLLVAAVVLFGYKTAAQNSNSSSALLRHIVIIKFKPGAPADSIKALDDVYLSLSESPLVKDFETGVSMVARDSGIVKHVYMTTFASKDDMKAYAKIPGYQSLFKISVPIADEVTVADYWIDK